MATRTSSSTRSGCALSIRVSPPSTVLASPTNDRSGSRSRINRMPSIRERAQLLGGTFEVASTDGAGTRLTVTVPLDSLNARDDRDIRRDGVLLDVGESPPGAAAPARARP